MIEVISSRCWLCWHVFWKFRKILMIWPQPEDWCREWTNSTFRCLPDVVPALRMGRRLPLKSVPIWKKLACNQSVMHCRQFPTTFPVVRILFRHCWSYGKSLPAIVCVNIPINNVFHESHDKITIYSIKIYLSTPIKCYYFHKIKRVKMPENSIVTDVDTSHVVPW